MDLAVSVTKEHGAEAESEDSEWDLAFHLLDQVTAHTQHAPRSGATERGHTAAAGAQAWTAVSR